MEKATPARMALSVPEAAETLGVSVAFAYQLAASHRLPTVRLGNRLLVPVAALEKMLECEAKPQPSEKADAPERAA